VTPFVSLPLLEKAGSFIYGANYGASTLKSNRPSGWFCYQPFGGLGGTGAGVFSSSTYRFLNFCLHTAVALRIVVVVVPIEAHHRKDDGEKGGVFFL
jgi:hypothetical protein